MSFSHYACLWDVSAAVEGEVVRAGEAAVTVAAFEWFNTGVFAVMPCQLVRASELPCAVIPRALVWLFTCEGKYGNINKRPDFLWNRIHVFKNMIGSPVCVRLWALR